MKAFWTAILLIPCLAATAQKAENKVISFTVEKEVNIKYYLVEGTNDSIRFDFVANIRSKGNSMLPVKYELAPSDDRFMIYRIKQVGLNNCVEETIFIDSKSTIRPLYPAIPGIIARGDKQ